MSDVFGIIGIGNPGKDYLGTRHNVGFEVLDLLAESRGLRWKSGFSGLLCDISISGKKVFLLKPQTYVNLSGRSVAQLIAYYQITIDNMLVVVDDFHLPIGKLRIRDAGSDGGHKGLTSIISTVGSDFCRLRIGIGTPKGDPAKFVLSRFSPLERETLDIVLRTAGDAVQDWVGKDLVDVQQQYNSIDYANV